MASKERKRYSPEFKLEAVKRTRESGKTVVDVARELDIPVAYLYQWRQDLNGNDPNIYPGSGRKKASKDSELQRLQKENAKLREERDILKKAAMFFARESGSDIDSSKLTERNSA